MKIKTKVALIFFVILFSVTIHFSFSNYFLRRILAETDILRVAHKMNEEVLQIRRYEKNFILRGSMEWAELWKAHLSALFSGIGEYKQLTQGKRDTSVLEELLFELKEYSSAVDKYIETYKDAGLRPEPEIFISSGRYILKLTQKIEDDSESFIRLYMGNIMKSRLSLFLIFLFIGITAYLFTCRIIINPIKKLQYLCRQIEKNGVFSSKHLDSLDILLKETSSKDEIADLIRAYKEMAIKNNNSYESLQDKMKEIENLYKLKSEFTSIVSHELRTPLTAIKEGIDLVVDGSTGQISNDQREFLGIAKRNVDRLADLINNVLNFSKLASKKVELKMEKVNLNDLINSVVNTYKTEIERKGLSLVVRLEPTQGLAVRTDADSITRVLINLMSNAIKFTDSGSITLFSEKDDKSNVVKVCVEDTGIGIKPQDLAKLFQPFVQVGNIRTRKTGGTGLGLAICKEIIEQLGGRTWVDSEFEKGSRFCFMIPIEERRKLVSA